MEDFYKQTGFTNCPARSFYCAFKCAGILTKNVEDLVKHNGCFSPAKIPTAMSSEFFSLEEFSQAWSKKAGR